MRTPRPRVVIEINRLGFPRSESQAEIGVEGVGATSELALRGSHQAKPTSSGRWFVGFSDSQHGAEVHS
jgi:hypothetical protein